MAPKKSSTSSPSWSVDILGPKVLTKPKTSGVPTDSSLSGKKLVVLYFSASWCPPCRSFSPRLIDFYNSCKNDLEVIFVSSDRDEKSFVDYFAKMPWLAVFPAYTSNENRDRQGRLASMFRIQGIPAVIVLDGKTGNFITDNARMEVIQAGGSDASKKALVQMWLSKEPVPIAQAVFNAGHGSENLFLRILKYFAVRPMHFFGVLYFVKRFLRYLEELGRDEIQDGKEL